MKSALIAFVMALATATALAASLTPPKGAVLGKFTIGILAQSDPLSRYMKGSKVWCAWIGDHVIVHINLRNGSVEHVTATIKPRYFIRRGGEHGSGLTSAKDYGFKAGELRNLRIDAGKPKGVPTKTPISRCAPYLFLIKSG